MIKVARDPEGAIQREPNGGGYDLYVVRRVSTECVGRESMLTAPPAGYRQEREATTLRNLLPCLVAAAHEGGGCWH